MADLTPGQEADSEGKDAIENFIDEIVEKLIDDGTADTSISDYSDSYLDENLNTSYNLREAADVLHDLSRYEETDSGMWEGVDDPQEAVKIQAACTYMNAVRSNFDDDMGTVNDEVGPVAEELMEERKVIEDQVEALEALLEQSEADEARLKALEGELKSFDASRQKRIKRLVLEAIGRKPKARGPKDWNP
jgi:hypothetical protein